ncbi:MAG TPA: ribosome small subunit-dependent GTPase A [Bryobacteraceae bacterium]|nr:ribosome small subunit-dependent GTPase A [Bryobacteraceae bacterium]
MIARVAAEHRNSYVLLCEDGSELHATLAGKLRFETTRREDLPAVGDFVRVRDSVIEEVLARRTVIRRKAAGETTEAQVLAANIDTVFVVAGLDHDFNLRRLERYCATVRASGVQAVVALNKSDLCDDLDERLRQVRAVAPGTDIVAISALCGDGIGALRPYLIPGETVAFLGSSGAGKSTLINLLLGRDRQLTGAVRQSDSRGRHTTTHRELLETTAGAFLIDTPGLRELQPWVDADDIDGAFPEIETLALQCHYRDCSHASEQGCAVQAAIEGGSLDAGRFASYVKMRKEAAYLERQLDVRAQLDQKAKWKKIHKAMRNVDKRA